jgi:FhaA, N-terminal domain/FHA domain
MNPLRALESRIAGLVEGGFGRLFRSPVRPIELAHKLAREMDEHRTASVSRTYAPNEYSVWLSPEDRARYEGVEHEVIDELCAYLLEHARREDLILASRPLIAFHTDEDLALGEFGIQARLVRVPAGEQEVAPGHEDAAHRHERSGATPPAPSPEPLDEHGQTMIYSASARSREALGARTPRRPSRALLTVGGRRLALGPEGGVVGRSRDCEVVLEDSGVSRHHAELRPSAEGWTVADLGSTNGVLLNGQDIHGGPHPLAPGDRLQLGSTELVFDIA